MRSWKDKSRDARTDMILGFLMGLFSIGFFAETYHFKLVKLANTVNAAFVPRILGVVVFLCSALLFAQGWRAYRKIPPGERRASTEERRRTQGAALRVTVIAVVLLASAALLQKLGFIVTMPVMMFCLFCVIEKPEKRRYGLYLLFSVLTPAALFFVFYYGFSSLLPMGILTPWLSRLL